MPPQMESDYYPYGGEIPITTGIQDQNYKFTGKERDSAAGLDNFGARYDSSALGRFMTPDWAAKPTTVPYAVFGNPQTLNLYAFVTNDPISRADADGHQDCNPTGGSPECNPFDNSVHTAVNNEKANQQAQNQASATKPAPAQNDGGSARARATQAGEAAVNFTLAKVKLGAALELATTAETPAGAIGTAYLATSAAGNGVTGTVQAVGAATGHTQITEEAAEVVSTLTTATGMGTFLVTGSLNKASTAEAIEGVVTSSPKDLGTGGTVARAAKAIDFAQDVYKVKQSIGNAIEKAGAWLQSQGLD